MADLAFLDTNVLWRHLLGDHPDHSPRATALIARIERDEVAVCTSDTVVFETVFTLERGFRQPKTRIRDEVLSVLELPAIMLHGKRRLRRAFDLYVQYDIPFADAYHAALVEGCEPAAIISFDRDFDRIPGVQRREP